MFLTKVKSTIKKYNMLRERDSILVGFSGGPDSVTLLRVLCEIKEEYSLCIHIAHLDHKFRGDESKADRRFCEDLAKDLGIGITCEEIDVPKIAAEKGISSEEAARIERYDFFKRTAEKRGIKKLAVGHNRDDQAETVLMRVLRGAGTLGLGGISPVKNIPSLTIIRPLIEMSRKEIEKFVGENSLEFRHDPSNDDVFFTRNRIRGELIPYLEKNFNSNVKEVLANMAENLRAENEFLEKFSNRKLRGLSRVKKKEILLDIKKLKRQPEAVRKRILRAALREYKGDLRRFTYQHWKEIEKLIDERPGNSIVDLPGGINIIKNKATLTLTSQPGNVRGIV
ncbi:MAG: tRNA lysidine(34) synthetase TilS [Candidatus Omnitrophica bacterium]|nr:tRNA lysidine(34) synthetase TilS [Candidatus Omnitrophota bacterium]